MVELLRTNDLVHLSWAEALLAAEGIATVVLDGHMSILEGNVDAIPRRLMVDEADLDAARALIDLARPRVGHG